jgi:hypothetical protein
MWLHGRGDKHGPALRLSGGAVADAPGACRSSFDAIAWAGSTLGRSTFSKSSNGEERHKIDPDRLSYRRVGRPGVAYQPHTDRWSPFRPRAGFVDTARHQKSRLTPSRS